MPEKGVGMVRRWSVSAVVCVAVVSFTVAASSGAAPDSEEVTVTSFGPPLGLTVYGRTLWNLEALLHDNFGRARVCLRFRDGAFLSATCGNLAEYGYLKDMFVGARRSQFKLVRRARPLALGNVIPLTVKGRYIDCGKVALSSLAGASGQGRRWLVLIHGWANLPVRCF